MGSGAPHGPGLRDLPGRRRGRRCRGGELVDDAGDADGLAREPDGLGLRRHVGDGPRQRDRAVAGRGDVDRGAVQGLVPAEPAVDPGLDPHRVDRRPGLVESLAHGVAGLADVAADRRAGLVELLADALSRPGLLGQGAVGQQGRRREQRRDDQPIPSGPDHRFISWKITIDPARRVVRRAIDRHQGKPRAERRDSGLSSFPSGARERGPSSRGTRGSRRAPGGCRGPAPPGRRPRARPSTAPRIRPSSRS